MHCAVCTRYYSRASKRVHRFGTTAEVIRADSTSVVPNYWVRIFDTCADYSSWHKAASVSKKRIKLGKQPQLPTFTPFKKGNLIFGSVQSPSSSSWRYVSRLRRLKYSKIAIANLHMGTIELDWILQPPCTLHSVLKFELKQHLPQPRGGFSAVLDSELNKIGFILLIL